MAGLAVAVAVPLIMCAGIFPGHLARILSGRSPTIGNPNDYKFPVGMTRDEVRAEWGRPHRRYERNGWEIWSYDCDVLGFFCIRMEFGADGRVVNSWW
jgi:hypothetical protein